jgi:hypothetical protein
MGDGWLDKRIDVVTAQMQERILDDSLSRLRKIAEATQSLATFLGETLPAETDRVVGALCKKEKDEAPVTDIRAPADGRKEYESAKSAAAREKMTADCLKDMTFEVLGGDQDECMRLRCAEDWLGDGSLLIGASRQPFEAARDWIEYLTGCLEPLFASHRLDDYITTDEEAGRYAYACVKEAETFVKYNLTGQRASCGNPITITLVVAPADSRLHAAFGRGRSQGVVVCAQDKDPTTAFVVRAEIGILGKAFQFRRDAAAVEASMVESPGLWTLGQLSHNVFWGDPDRWSSLRLFFLGLATSRIQRAAAPPSLGGKGGARFEYWLDTDRGQRVRLGLRLQDAIFEFIGPAHSDSRSKLRMQLGDYSTAAGLDPAIRAALRNVADTYQPIAREPAKVPSVPLRKVLEWRLKTLSDDPSPASIPV